ncbi:hypothetical protein ON010_g10840 [Phytophthora cinnamomi]|nr:hypothetical protein ON010_g10840 [Phytophthora cinnamomi]
MMNKLAVLLVIAFAVLMSSETLAAPTARFDIDSEAAHAVEINVAVDKRSLRGLEMADDAGVMKRGACKTSPQNSWLQ